MLGGRRRIEGLNRPEEVQPSDLGLLRKADTPLRWIGKQTVVEIAVASRGDILKFV